MKLCGEIYLKVQNDLMSQHDMTSDEIQIGVSGFIKIVQYSVVCGDYESVTALAVIVICGWLKGEESGLELEPPDAAL